jgi:DNA primase
LIARAKPVMDYYFEALTGDLDLATAKGKAEAVRLLGPLIAQLGDRVQRTHYLQQLGRMVQVDERSLWQQIRQTGGGKRPARSRRPEPTAEERLEAPLGLDGHCLSFVLYYPALLVEADEAMRACEEEPLQPADLSRPDDRAILTVWREWIDQGNEPNARGPFYDTIDERLQERVDRLIQIQEQQPEAPEALMKDKVLDAISRLRLQNLRRQNRELGFLQSDAQRSGDQAMVRSYLESSVKVRARIRRLEQGMNERSLAGRRQREDAAVRVPLTAE